jgi:hypothetical protein
MFLAEGVGRPIVSKADYAAPVSLGGAAISHLTPCVTTLREPRDSVMPKTVER